MTKIPTNPDRLLAAVEKIAQVRRALVQEIATRNAVSPLQVELLRLLASAPPPEHRPTDLSIELAVSTATLTDALQALRRKSLVTDRPDPKDGRRKTLALSAKGRSTARAIETEFSPFSEALSQATDPTASIAVSVLIGVIGRLYDNGVVTTDRSCVTCAHYQPNIGMHGTCSLLQLTLSPETLRVRCNEHQAAA